MNCTLERAKMRVCGQDKILQFIENCNQKTACDDAKALLYELKNGKWANHKDFQDDYPHADIDDLPKVKFLFANSSIQLECITCFDRGVLLVISCRENRALQSENKNRTDQEAA